MSNKKKEFRQFGLLVGFLLPLIIGYLIPTLFGHSFRFWTIYAGLPLIILGIINPISLSLPYKVWMKIGHILGWINSRIILSIVYLFVLVPIAFFMRVRGYDPLQKKKESTKSYKIIKRNISDLKKLF